MLRTINPKQPYPNKHKHTPNAQQNFHPSFPSKAKEGRPVVLCQLLESSFHVFHQRKRSTGLFFFLERYIFNECKYSLSSLVRQKGWWYSLDSRSQEYNQLASLLFLFLSPPSEAQTLLPGPLFLSRPHTQPVDTVCLRRENS